MSHNALYAIHYKARIQRGVWHDGVWHAEDDLEVTGYGNFQEQTKYIAAPNEELVRAYWENMIKYWPKEHETTLVKIENLGQLTIIDVT